VEKKIYEQLRTGTQSKEIAKLPENATAREKQRIKAFGEQRETLTEFQIDDLEALLIEDEIISQLVRLIGQGKEANVYWVKDPDGKDMALKLFRIHTTSHRDAFSKVEDTGKLQVAENLALREYLNISYAKEGGVRVPSLGVREEFVFTMGFLGDTQGPAPLLRDVNLVEVGVDPIEILEQILDELYILFNTAEMAHGDFSEHNLVWYQEKIWVIDFLQSHRWHPSYHTPQRIRKREALTILEKDTATILNYFKKTYRQSFELDEVMENMVDEAVEDWAPDELMSEYYDPNWRNPKHYR